MASANPQSKNDYRKTPKNLLCHRVMSSKDADGIANGVDPDLGQHYLPRPICPKTVRRTWLGHISIIHGPFLL